MSFILNALKKAENKGFEKENIKIKKQVLILRRQARGKKIKICSLIAILLGSLLVGWFLGHFQYNQSKNAADLIIVHRPLVDKNELRESNDSLSEKHARVDHAKKTGELVSSYNSHDGVDDKEIEKLEYKIEEVNPPIPVRTVTVPVRTVTVPVKVQIEEAAQKTSEQAETKKGVDSIQNYSELPFLIKQKLPQLEISLHFYNSNPARRIVRINGKILHENDSIDVGLIVQEIKSTSTVLNHDGYLFELNAPGG